MSEHKPMGRITHNGVESDWDICRVCETPMPCDVVAAQATIAQRDAQVAALQADRDAWRNEREDVANLLYTQEGRLGALTEQLAARDAQVAELTAALTEVSNLAGSGLMHNGTDGKNHYLSLIGLRADRALLARTLAAPEADG